MSNHGFHSLSKQALIGRVQDTNRGGRWCKDGWKSLSNVCISCAFQQKVLVILCVPIAAGHAQSLRTWYFMLSAPPRLDGKGKAGAPKTYEHVLDAYGNKSREVQRWSVSSDPSTVPNICIGHSVRNASWVS